MDDAKLIDAVRGVLEHAYVVLPAHNPLSVYCRECASSARVSLRTDEGIRHTMHSMQHSGGCKVEIAEELCRELGDERSEAG